MGNIANNKHKANLISKFKAHPARNKPQKADIFYYTILKMKNDIEISYGFVQKFFIFKYLYF